MYEYANTRPSFFVLFLSVVFFLLLLFSVCVYGLVNMKWKTPSYAIGFYHSFWKQFFVSSSFSFFLFFSNVGKYEMK